MNLPPHEFIRQHLHREIEEAMHRFRDEIDNAAFSVQAARGVALGESEIVDFHRLTEEVINSDIHLRQARVILAEVRGLRQADSIARRAREGVDATSVR